MTNTNRSVLLAAMMLFMLLVTSCGGGSTDLPQAGSVLDKLAGVVEPGNNGESQIWDLIAGQHILVGQVEVTYDEDFLYVKYVTFDQWMLAEAHLYVGLEKPTKGAPGKFPYKREFSPYVSEHTFKVPLPEIGLECEIVPIYFASHAVVIKPGQGETAWGGYWNSGDPFYDFTWKKKWGGGFIWEWPGCNGDEEKVVLPDLPDDYVLFWTYDGTYSTWDIVFSEDLNLPPGSFMVGDQERWVGWCVEQGKFLDFGFNYLALIYSTYEDPNNLPEYARNDNWDLINFMINGRRGGLGVYNRDWTVHTNHAEFQDAVWYLIGDTPYDGLGPIAKSLADDAETYGEGYVPGEGEWYSLLLIPYRFYNPGDPEYRKQLVIIEVDP